jgi:hypothetical protein
MTELDLVRLRELAAELGYWPASTDEEHVARLRAQDARYNEQAAKWQKMMGAWVTQVKKSTIPVHDEAEIAAQLTGRTSSFTNRGQ